jgi:hypothetical protein
VKIVSAKCLLPNAVVLNSAPAIQVTEKLIRIRLKRNEVIRLEKRARARSIEVTDGVVWLTSTPANGDIVLRQDEQFQFGGNWPYVIQALEPAELTCIA